MSAAMQPSIWCPGINLSHRLANGLVWASPMWDGDGDKVRGCSGNGYIGTLTNMEPATDWVATPYGTGLQTDGSDEWVSIDGPQNVVTGSANATLCALIYRGSTGIIGSFGFGKTSTANYKFDFLHYSDNVIYCEAENGSQSYPSVTYTGTGWLFYALAFDGTQAAGVGRLRLSVNGVEIALGGGGADPAATLASAANLETLQIARQRDTRYGNQTTAFCGLWNRTLTLNEVRQLGSDPYAMFGKYGGLM